MEDLKAGSLLQEVDFPKNADCSPDGDIDSSRYATPLSLAGRQDVSGNRGENRTARLEEAEP